MPELSPRLSRTTYTLTAYDYNLLLKNRIVAYRGETAESIKTGTHDDMMKSFVRDNLGDNSGTDYDGNAITTRQVSDLIVDADTSAGNTGYIIGAELENLLQTLQQLQADSVASGKEIFFGCYPNASYAPRFRTLSLIHI